MTDAPVIPRRLLIVLLLAALLLPVAICVAAGVGHLLSAMQDTAGGAVLGRIALALGVLWVVDLILLVVLLAVHALAAGDGPPEQNRPLEQERDE